MAATLIISVVICCITVNNSEHVLVRVSDKRLFFLRFERLLPAHACVQYVKHCLEDPLLRR